MIKVGDTAQEAQAAPTQIGAHGLRLPASFAGDLPCADCERLRYRLNLWADQVFHLRRTWEGTDVRRDAVGRWSVDPDRRTADAARRRRGADASRSSDRTASGCCHREPAGGRRESYVLTAGRSSARSSRTCRSGAC